MNDIKSDSVGVISNEVLENKLLRHGLYQLRKETDELGKQLDKLDALYAKKNEEINKIIRQILYQDNILGIYVWRLIDEQVALKLQCEVSYREFKELHSLINEEIIFYWDEKLELSTYYDRVEILGFDNKEEIYNFARDYNISIRNLRLVK